jgi:hypothetical protein
VGNINSITNSNKDKHFSIQHLHFNISTMSEDLKLEQETQTASRLLIELFNKASTDKKILLAFKEFAVKLQLFELGASLRGMERCLFPDSEKKKAAKEYISAAQLALGMVGIRPEEDTVWLLCKILDLHKEKGQELNIRDAAAIVAEKDEIYDTNSSIHGNQ